MRADNFTTHGKKQVTMASPNPKMKRSTSTEKVRFSEKFEICVKEEDVVAEVEEVAESKSGASELTSEMSKIEELDLDDEVKSPSTEGLNKRFIRLRNSLDIRREKSKAAS